MWGRPSKLTLFPSLRYYFLKSSLLNWLRLRDITGFLFNSRPSLIMGIMLKKPADEPGSAWVAIVIGMLAE
jgi:hypothetical protein